MQTVLFINSGPLSGRKAWVRNGQGVTVGRTLDSDFVVPEDEKLSGTHFRLECIDGVCRLRDLGSTNGTALNGEKITRGIVSDGDRIQAGKTGFLVRLRSGRDAPPSTEIAAIEDRVSTVVDLPVPFGTRAHSDVERVILMVRSSLHDDRKLWLVPGQKFVFGRSEMSDFSMPADPELSSRHFQLECQPTRCLITDLGSTSGTRVNGEPMVERTLVSGDRVSAGALTVDVRIEGTAADRDDERASVAGGLPAQTVVPGFHRVPLADGREFYQALSPDPTPIQVVQGLAQQSPMFLVFDPAKLKRFDSLDVSSSKNLFDWLVTEDMTGAVPVALPRSQFEPIGDLIQQGWNRDAVLCVYSTLGKAQLREHLVRVAALLSDDVKHSPTGKLAFVWPSVLTALLLHRERAIADLFFTGVEAVLVESDSPGGWAVFAAGDLGPKLVKAGVPELA